MTDLYSPTGDEKQGDTTTLDHIRESFYELYGLAGDVNQGDAATHIGVTARFIP